MHSILLQPLLAIPLLDQMRCWLTTGSYNTTIGSSRHNLTRLFKYSYWTFNFIYNTTGSFNVAIGLNSMYASTTARYNTAIGSYALKIQQQVKIILQLVITHFIQIQPVTQYGSLTHFIQIPLVFII